jgi:hypothetical protein
MNEFSDWMQNHWYELGSLLVQSAFLVAGVWFARKILRTMRASQEQVGALLRLSVSDALAERSTPAVIAERATLTEERAVTLPDGAQGDGRIVAAWRNLRAWLQTPMSSGGAAPWRRVINWLQAPAGS